jgi:metallo-beta-lactamase family protein
MTVRDGSAPPRLTCLGAAGMVSGSRHLLDVGRSRILIDCGLFQGEKQLRDRNWRPLEVPAASIDAVVLTHAHLDHSGYLPRLVREGFRGKILATAPTTDLLGLLLYDSAKCQAEDAAYANRKGYAKHRPALPLYEERDVDQVLRQLEDQPRGSWFEPAAGIRCRYHDAGHMLGSSFVETELAPGLPTGPVRVLFSGDIGRYDAPLYHDPQPPPACDYLVCESTYGDRDHLSGRPLDELERVVQEAIGRGGMLLVASFAVGRAQQLVYLLRTLMAAGRVANVPIWVDSPMAVDATAVFRRHLREHDFSEAISEGVVASLESGGVRMARLANESKAINAYDGPGIIIASSGMMNGGRILHHLKRRLPLRETTVLLAGFQAKGTRGRSLLDGARFLRIHGQDIPVEATIRKIDALSGHGDRREIGRWLEGLPPPRKTFLVHGEPAAAAGMRDYLSERFGWQVHVPQIGERFELLSDP